jgi:hypothetical protein
MFGHNCSIHFQGEWVEGVSGSVCRSHSWTWCYPVGGARVIMKGWRNEGWDQTLLTLRPSSQLKLCRCLIISLASVMLSVDVSFEIIIATNVTITGFQDVKPCSLIERYQYFRGTCSFHLHGTWRWRKVPTKKRTLRGFGPLANYAERATAAVGEVVLTFADRGCCVVSATDPPGRSLGFLDRSRYYFFQVALQLSSQGWVNPVPDPLLLRKSGSSGNRTQDLWICSQELWPHS